MPTRESALIGAPCWVDLTSSDPERSVAFYTQLLGWSAEAPMAEFGGYRNFTRDGSRIAGCMANQPEMSTPDGWAVYFATDDAQKTVDVAVANGARVVVPPMQVDDLGTMAVLTDVGGAVVGLWQPEAHQGFATVGEPGTPSWFELSTRDYEASIDFYCNLFSLGKQVVSDGPEMRYTVLTSGEEQVVGIMDATAMLPEGVPPHWAVYLGVQDTEAALRTATALGGTVLTPAMDTEYGNLAVATDVTGAVFKLVAPNDAMPAKG